MDKKLRVIRTATGVVEQEVPHGNVVSAVAFHPEGHLIATGSMDKKLRVFRSSLSVATGRYKVAFGLRQKDLVQEILYEVEHGEGVLVVAFHPQGHLIATGRGERPLAAERSC